ncbi:MAG: tetratricopeptide repeat protein [Planctomycetia bacterium]|nr:tetratricopeptide repeat protein [Planctomycetia bacterium]
MSSNETNQEASSTATATPARDPGDRAPHRSIWVAAGALVLMTLVAYLPALSAKIDGYDDMMYIGDNVTLRTLDGLRLMWFAPGSLPQYYPLTFTTFWIEYHLWGLQPAGFHFVNIVLHAMSAVLLWRLLARLKVPGGWLAAAVFAVHPVGAESVAWVAERKNVLSLALALASMIYYLRFAPPEGCADDADPPSPWYYALALVLFAAALASKTAVAPMPAVLLVIYWWKSGRIPWFDAGLLLPFFGVALGLGLITMWVERQHLEGSWVVGVYGPLERLLIAGRALWFYAGKVFWPYPLMFFYPQWTIDAHAPSQYLYPLAAVGVIIGLWLARNRIGRGPLAAVLIFAGMLAPVLGFVTVSFTRLAFVADHFQYHAAIALIALAAVGWALVARWAGILPASGVSAGAEGGQDAGPPLARRALAAGAVAILLAVLGALTFHQAQIHHDIETLALDILKKNPQSWSGWLNLAGIRNKQGRYAEAEQYYNEAMRLNPNETLVLSESGSFMLNIGSRTGFRPGQAEEAFARLKKAVTMTPNFPQARTAYGFALLQAGKVDEAFTHLARSLELRPYDAKTMYGIGLCLSESGRGEEARSFFDRALAIMPNEPDILQGVGIALAKQGRFDEAVERLQLSLKRDRVPEHGHYLLGGVLAAQGKVDQAIEHYNEAIRLRPTFAEPWVQLGEIALAQGDADRAMNYFQEALRVQPDSRAAQDGMQRALGLPSRKPRN